MKLHRDFLFLLFILHNVAYVQSGEGDAVIKAEYIDSSSWREHTDIVDEMCVEKGADYKGEQNLCSLCEQKRIFHQKWLATDIMETLCLASDLECSYGFGNCKQNYRSETIEYHASGGKRNVTINVLNGCECVNINLPEELEDNKLIQ